MNNLALFISVGIVGLFALVFVNLGYRLRDSRFQKRYAKQKEKEMNHEIETRKKELTREVLNVSRIEEIDHLSLDADRISELLSTYPDDQETATPETNATEDKSKGKVFIH